MKQPELNHPATAHAAAPQSAERDSAGDQPVHVDALNQPQREDAAQRPPPERKAMKQREWKNTKTQNKAEALAYPICRGTEQQLDKEIKDFVVADGDLLSSYTIMMEHLAHKGSPRECLAQCEAGLMHGAGLINRGSRVTMRVAVLAALSVNQEWLDENGQMLVFDRSKYLCGYYALYGVGISPTRLSRNTNAAEYVPQMIAEKLPVGETLEGIIPLLPLHEDLMPAYRLLCRTNDNQAPTAAQSKAYYKLKRRERLRLQEAEAQPVVKSVPPPAPAALVSELVVIAATLAPLLDNAGLTPDMREAIRKLQAMASTGTSGEAKAETPGTGQESPAPDPGRALATQPPDFHTEYGQFRVERYGSEIRAAWLETSPEKEEQLKQFAAASQFGWHTGPGEGLSVAVPGTVWRSPQGELKTRFAELRGHFGGGQQKVA